MINYFDNFNLNKYWQFINERIHLQAYFKHNFMNILEGVQKKLGIYRPNN